MALLQLSLVRWRRDGGQLALNLLKLDLRLGNGRSRRPQGGEGRVRSCFRRRNSDGGCFEVGGCLGGFPRADNDFRRPLCLGKVQNLRGADEAEFAQRVELDTDVAPQ